MDDETAEDGLDFTPPDTPSQHYSYHPTPMADGEAMGNSPSKDDAEGAGGGQASGEDHEADIGFQFADEGNSLDETRDGAKAAHDAVTPLSGSFAKSGSTGRRGVMTPAPMSSVE